MLPDRSGVGEPAGVLPSVRLDDDVAALAAAREAWSRGDMVACLTQLDKISEPRRASDRSEAVLLRARALYRLKRYADTAALLAPLLESFTVADERSTARMLHGAAVVRSGEFDRGLALLADAADDAALHEVHRAIRAEIAHARALGYWMRGDLGEAEALALVAESAGADVISVRATQLLGFIARSRGSHLEALALFRVACEAYWHCRHRDRELIEMTVLEVAALELQLRSKSVHGTHRTARRVTDVPCAGGTRATAARLQTFAADAWLYALDGDATDAFRMMREADAMASSEPWRVWTLSGRAALALAFDEPLSAEDHARTALTLAETVDWNATRAEERVGLLFLTEALAMLGRDEAAKVLARYTSIEGSYDPGETLRTDPRLRALEEYAAALVERLHGSRERAAALLRSSSAGFERAGHLWRGVLARIELVATLPPTADREAAYDVVKALVREHFSTSFLASHVGLISDRDPIARRIPRAQRAVLGYVLEGHDGPEIARRMGRSYCTVRNHLARLRSLFDVSSTAELIVACHRRGMVGRSVRHVDASGEATDVAGSVRRKRPAARQV